MKTHETIILTLLAALAATLTTVSCGPSYKSTVAVAQGTHSYVDVDYVDYVFYVDNHKLSKKGADHVFDVWADASHLKKNITGKRLLSIAPRDEACYLTYDFRMVAGNQRRVTLIVYNYYKTYKKSPRKASAENPHYTRTPRNPYQ